MKALRIVWIVLGIWLGGMVPVQACSCLSLCCCTCAKLVLTIAGQKLEETIVKLLYKELGTLKESVLDDLVSVCTSDDDDYELSEASINVLEPKNIFLNDDGTVKRTVKVLVPLFVQKSSTKSEKGDYKVPARAVGMKLLPYKQGFAVGIETKKIMVNDD